MLTNKDKIIGCFLYDCFGEEIGKIESLLVDTKSYTLRYCAVTIGGFLSTRGKTLLLPKNIIEPKGVGKVVSPKSITTVRDAPIPYNFEEINRQEEQEIHDYFDLPPYYETEEESPEPEEEGENHSPAKISETEE